MNNMRYPNLGPIVAGRLREAMQAYPRANAVLVRRHGVYVWGRDWVHAKTQAESYDYLFEAALRMHALGVPPCRAPGPPPLANGHAARASAHSATLWPLLLLFINVRCACCPSWLTGRQIQPMLKMSRADQRLQYREP